ncbi:MAG TPA: HIT family protein [Phycisphaerae bacterium]|jgi:histidine triad (HIT) family protein|nr:HIT family protein [Phycisphaerae bacterium]HOB76541.1 HIT family protein [Phycisphaerae bacterium]HOJ56564.1 HIT family protein [Phycisphaerae bacterium]HOL28354.1 HIT family protein [Phycisphaerae bacterium]HPP19940.1 HIT family protein [Phycisphaerae bacterium]
MPSVFTRMLQGQEPGRFVYQDADTAAIVSNTPVKPGHCIVFPREEVTNWLDLPPELAGRLMATCQKVGRAIAEVYQPVRVSLTIISIVVPHVHIHLVPANSVPEVDFTKQDQNARPEDLDASAEKIRAALRKP